MNPTAIPRWFLRSRGQSGSSKFGKRKVSIQIPLQFKFQCCTPSSHGERSKWSYNAVSKNSWFSSFQVLFFHQKNITFCLYNSYRGSCPSAPKFQKIYLRDYWIFFVQIFFKNKVWFYCLRKTRFRHYPMRFQNRVIIPIQLPLVVDLASTKVGAGE